MSRFEVWDCSRAPHGLMQVWETTVDGVDGFYVTVTTPSEHARVFVGPHDDGSPSTERDAIDRGIELGRTAGMAAVVMIPGVGRASA